MCEPKKIDENGKSYTPQNFASMGAGDSYMVCDTYIDLLDVINSANLCVYRIFSFCALEAGFQNTDFPLKSYLALSTLPCAARWHVICRAMAQAGFHPPLSPLHFFPLSRIPPPRGER